MQDNEYDEKNHNKYRDPRTFQFNLPPELRPQHQTLAEQWLPQAIVKSDDAKMVWERCTSSRSKRKPPNESPTDLVEVVVVHATAGASTLGAFSVMEEGRASYHWLVPDEDEAAHGKHVWATAPEGRAAWHVRYGCSHPDVCEGAKGLNAKSLGIEIVNAQTASRARIDRFSDWQIEATAEIVRYAWAKYPNLKHVVSHARLDPKRRTDPGPNFPWDRFQMLVLKGGW